MESTNEEIYLSTLVKGIVSSPLDVEISRKVDEIGVLLTLTVNPSDMGVLIGKEGNTVKAIRTLIRIIGMKAQQRINLKVTDPRASYPQGSFVAGSAKPFHVVV
jgi:predicted RNA-binding protein YlqC (UPF0109 family)